MSMGVIPVGISRQLRIVSALTIREVRLRNSKHAFGQLFDLLEAIVFIIIHWAIFTFMHRHLLIGDSLLLFISTGILPVLFFRTISVKTATALEAAKSVTSIPYVEALDYSLARSFVEFLSFTMMFGLGFVMIYALGLSRFAIPYDFTPIIVCILMLTVFSFGIGLVNSFITFLFHPWKLFWGFFSRVQIFLSAVFFIPEYMPPELRNIVAYNPMMHFVSLFRTGFYPTYPTHLLSVTYIGCWTAAVLILGLALERVLRNHRAGH
ncbi:capsular polysaccharide transport system permease protein [Rhizobium sp. PP-WC-2G-219]|nr:capsular polysaccharide transport system permease protein [Rhizobium sp. PP-CC-3A-592]PYE46838.1 capsular polysaccharide transport system permease protein [Rhizobium sp. PP-F2F-G20b]TCL95992.1 capsular polysaccharide transport system permease protein [Rhizobium sp. PP-WC-2G-219]